MSSRITRLYWWSSHGKEKSKIGFAFPDLPLVQSILDILKPVVDVVIDHLMASNTTIAVFLVNQALTFLPLHAVVHILFGNSHPCLRLGAIFSVQSLVFGQLP